jgi:hypothetical protein
LHRQRLLDPLSTALPKSSTNTLVFPNCHSLRQFGGFGQFGAGRRQTTVGCAGRPFCCRSRLRHCVTSSDAISLSLPVEHLLHSFAFFDRLSRAGLHTTSENSMSDSTIASVV